MAKLLRGVIVLFWLLATAIIGYLVYSVLSAETDPQVIWGWLVLCGLTFCSATFLAYTAVYARHHSHSPQD